MLLVVCCWLICVAQIVLFLVRCWVLPVGVARVCRVLFVERCALFVVCCSRCSVWSVVYGGLVLVLGARSLVLVCSRGRCMLVSKIVACCSSLLCVVVPFFFSSLSFVACYLALGVEYRSFWCCDVYCVCVLLFVLLCGVVRCCC